MGMNIKNPEAERLTRQLAEATGESLTEAITASVRERLERVHARAARQRPEARRERLLELGQEIAASLPEPWATQPHGELLYDDLGLPR